MPQNARINQTDVTADYANVALWEAGEDGQDYGGAVTVGVQEDYYTLLANLQIRNGFVNGFRLEALSGQEAKISDTTFGAGFGGAFNLDLRVANGHVLSLKLDPANWLRTGDTSVNFIIEKSVTTGAFGSTILQSTQFVDSLCINSGATRVIDSISEPNSILRSTIINLSGPFSVRSRNVASVVDVNDSCFYTAGAGTSLEVLSGGTFTGDYNATHEATNAPGANAVINMPRVLADVFTNPVGNDYTPKVGGVLDGSSSTGGFIGATEDSSGITVTGDTASFDYNALTGTVDLAGEILVTGSTASFDYAAINGSVDLTGQLLVTGQTANFDYIALPGTIDLTGEIIVTGLTANFDYTGENGVVELGAVINVVGQTANFDFNGVNAEVSLTGEIIIIGDTATFNYQALSGLVVIGEGQKIGTVTAGFADSDISVQYKQNTITVNFGE